MQIIGHGIDLIELDKMRRLVETTEADFIARCFTPGEQVHASNGPNRFATSPDGSPPRKRSPRRWGRASTELWRRKK